MDVALYGGSFDPPHVGHVLAAAYALATGGFDRVLVVPVFSHAFDKPLAPFDHRVEMTRLAFAPLRHVEVSTVEAQLGAPSRTIRTLERLRAEHPEYRLRLMVGADVLADAPKWLAFDEVIRKAPLFVLGRAGVDAPGAPPPVLPQVSSTSVRELLVHRSARATDDPELARSVPRDVLAYVDAHGLYR
jgi:nicotinate-nucleotide adenylyltransferase